MISPGLYTLAILGVTTPLATVPQSEVDGLDGMNAVTLEAEVLGATGGTSVSALVQTTMDGSTWLDIARFDFTAAGKKYAVIEALSAKAVTAYAALAAEGVNDGLLGNSLRAVITSVGTFTNTTLAVRASVR